MPFMFIYLLFNYTVPYFIFFVVVFLEGGVFSFKVLKRFFFPNFKTIDSLSLFFYFATNQQNKDCHF